MATAAHSCASPLPCLHVCVHGSQLLSSPLPCLQMCAYNSQLLPASLGSETVHALMLHADALPLTQLLSSVNSLLRLRLSPSAALMGKLDARLFAALEAAAPCLQAETW